MFRPIGTHLYGQKLEKIIKYVLKLLMNVHTSDESRNVTIPELYRANTSVFFSENVTISRIIPAYTSVFSYRNVTIPKLYGAYTSVFFPGNVTIPGLQVFSRPEM